MMLDDRRPDLPTAPNDHFDGRRFFNPGRDTMPATGKRRPFALWRWLLTRQRDLVPWSVAERQPQAVVAPRSTTPCITWIGHASTLIQIADLNILTDPVFADTVSPLPGIGPKRAHPPGIAYNDLPPIDIVLISHAHYDHLEAETITALARDHAPVFIAGLGLQRWLAARGATRIRTLDWWQRERQGVLDITAVPARHWSRRGLADRNRSLWCGYVVTSADHGVYFAGDSGYDGEMFREIGARFPALDMALLPIGAYEPRAFMKPQHMNPEEAVRALIDLGAARAIAIHFGTFRLTDEAREQPPIDLAAALAARAIDTGCFVVPAFGQTIETG